LSGLPGLRVPFYPLGLPGVLIPTTWWNPGLYMPWKERHGSEFLGLVQNLSQMMYALVYKRFGNDTISLVAFLAGPPSFYTANLDVARQVAGGGHKTSFIKPEDASRALL